MIVQSTTLDTEAKVIAIYGGTSWSKIEGRFLLGQSSSYAINSTGGEATHTLTVSEMPSHKHSTTKGANINTEYGGAMRAQESDAGTAVWGARSGAFDTLANTGGGAAHNNMPPYKVIYIWERTA